MALFAISCLLFLGFYKGVSVSESIAAVALGIAGANSAEGIFTKPAKPLIGRDKKKKQQNSYQD